MSENIIKVEKGPEAIPTMEEVQVFFDDLLRVAEYENPSETIRQEIDEKGLFLWNIKIIVDDGHVEYQYMRKGQYEIMEDGKLVKIATAKTAIGVAFFDEDGSVIGGDHVASCIDGEWKIF